MKYIILLFLSLFATSLPIISFSQMDYSAPPTIIQQIPSTNTQSQPGYLILATIIINDSGGTKVSSDFMVNIIGEIVGKSFILGSFQALPAPEVKIVSMQEGNYSVSISNPEGYKISQQNECQGDIEHGEVKTCLITLNDEASHVVVRNDHQLNLHRIHTISILELMNSLHDSAHHLYD